MDECWKTEGDAWTGVHQGYKYNIYRHPVLGHLCASVDVENPPFDFNPTSIKVHGGINAYKNGWLYFDCAHMGDYVPHCQAFNDHVKYPVYRDHAYVKNECEKVIEQLIALKNPFITAHEFYKLAPVSNTEIKIMEKKLEVLGELMDGVLTSLLEIKESVCPCKGGKIEITNKGIDKKIPKNRKTG